MFNLQNLSFLNSSYYNDIKLTPTTQNEDYSTLALILGYSIFHISITHTNIKTDSIILLSKKILLYLSNIFALIVLVPFLIFFFITKQFVHIYLNCKHGTNYKNILSSGDSIWAVEDKSTPVINVLVFIKRECLNPETLLQEIISVFDKKVFKNPDKHVKLTCVKCRTFGYTFLLKNQLNLTDCVRVLEINANEEDLEKILGSCCSNSLPKDNSALWEVLVFSKSFQTKPGTLPVVLRFNHIVGDGLSLTKFFLNIFDISLETSFPKEIKCSNQKTTCNFWQNLNVALSAPCFLVHQSFLRKKDKNILHDTDELSGNKIVAYATENGTKLVNVVKEIKKIVTGVTFSDVVLTAISRSLEEYFWMELKVVPDFITVAIPAHLSNLHLDSSYSTLQNKFSIGLLDLPIKSNKSNSLVEKLLHVHQFTEQLKQSINYQVNHLLLSSLCGIIPHPVLKLCLKSDQLTMIISNVPGVKKFHVFNNNEIQDVAVFIPHRGSAGLGLTVLTYDNRFQLGLSVDEAILPFGHKAQGIVNNVFKNIELLHEEVRKKFSKNK